MNSWTTPVPYVHVKDRKMKKQILAVLAAATILTPVASQAQTSRDELRRDTREIRDERQDLNQAKRHGTPAQVRDARGDVRDARQERREDWRDYRRNHRDNFRAAKFYAPFRYRSFNIGISLNPQYYRSRYFVNNISHYRLPAPGRNMRYVRHYNDLLLVNIRSGRIIDIYRGYFW
jgi:Ni/Co efflux regulator RcnB